MTQPDPKPAHGDVWAELIGDECHTALRALMEGRRELGIARYGVPLQRDNGRDHLLDLREELLDAMAYAHAANLHGVVRAVRRLLVQELAAQDERARLAARAAAP